MSVFSKRHNEPKTPALCRLRKFDLLLIFSDAAVSTTRAHTRFASWTHESALTSKPRLYMGSGLWRFAIEHSGGGFHRVSHRKNCMLSGMVYVAMVSGVLFFFGYLIYRMTGDPSLWTLEQTTQDPTDLQRPPFVSDVHHTGFESDLPSGG